MKTSCIQSLTQHFFIFYPIVFSPCLGSPGSCTTSDLHLSSDLSCTAVTRGTTYYCTLSGQTQYVAGIDRSWLPFPFIHTRFGGFHFSLGRSVLRYNHLEDSRGVMYGVRNL